MSSPQSKARVIGLMRPLKDVTVTAGETATFECELSYEGIAVEWFLGGTKLEPSDRVSPTHLSPHNVPVLHFLLTRAFGRLWPRARAGAASRLLSVFSFVCSGPLQLTHVFI